jgi:hypothetical protein
VARVCQWTSFLVRYFLPWVAKQIGFGFRFHPALASSGLEM